MRIPFSFSVHGTKGRRVAQRWTAASEVVVDVPELPAGAVDGRLVLEGRCDLGMSLIAGVAYAPVSLGKQPSEPFSLRHAGPDPAKGAVAPAGGGTLPVFPWLHDGPIDRRTVAETLPSDEERMAIRAMRIGSFLAFVDGRLYTSRLEPVVSSVGWQLQDLASDPSMHVLPGFCRHETELGDADWTTTMSGDVDAVRWRFDNAAALLSAAVDRVASLADEFHAFPIGREAMRGDARRLLGRIAMAGVEGGPDLPDVAEDVGALLREAGARLSAGVPASKEQHLQEAEALLARAGVALRGRARAAIPDEDLEVLSSFRR